MKYLVTISVVLLALLVTTEVSAQGTPTIEWKKDRPECHLEVGGYSYHYLDRENEINYNEENPLLGATCNKVSAIAFKNSLSNWTLFANYRFELYNEPWLNLGLRVGGFWSEEDYLLGLDVGPAASLEFAFFDNYAVSFLWEAVSLHWRVRL